MTDVKSEITMPETFIVKVAKIDYKVDTAKLTPEAILHCLRNGVQRYVNDACGGKDKDAEGKAEIAIKQIAKLEADTFTLHTRASGIGEPAINRFIKAVMRKVLDLKTKEYKDLDPQKRGEYLMAQFDDADENRQKELMRFATRLQEIDKEEKEFAASMK